MHPIAHAFLALLVLGLALVAAPVATAADRAVTMRDNSYSPVNVTIRPGDTVTWTNAGDLPHDASGAGWSTPLLDPFQSDAVTFTKPGTYPYQCTIHAEMRGTVVVRAAGAIPPTDTVAEGGGPATLGPLLVALFGVLGAGCALRRSRVSR